MASYIGKVTIGAADYPIANSVYATCSTSANTPTKEIIYSDFDTLADKVSIPIKFVHGNEVSTGVTLKFNNASDAYAVEGNCLCGENEVITFTYEDNEVESARKWRSHKIGITVSENNTSGVITIDGQTVGNILSGRIDALNSSLSGLNSAMHFRGAVAVDPTRQTIPGDDTYSSGDVVLGPNHKEYVLADNNEWIELGDEGSYVLISSLSNGVATRISDYVAGAKPTLTVTDTEVSQVTLTTTGENPASQSQVDIPTSISGKATIAEVNEGKLIIRLGSDVAINSSVRLNSTAKTVGSASGWNDGTLPSFTPTDLTVKIPAPTPTP